MLRAYLWVEYDIEEVDDLMAYLVDYIVYGEIYGILNLKTTFTEINFFPDDLFCYLFNFYGEG